MEAIGVRVIPDVLEESLEEIAFLFVQRRKLLFDREITVAQLRAHDARITAQQHVLRVGGEASGEIAGLRLGDAFGAWPVYACALTWMSLKKPTPAEVWERLESAGMEARAGWREALRRVDRDLVRRLFSEKSLTEAPPSVRASAADACGWHGLLDPGTFQALARDDLPETRGNVARHAAPAGAAATAAAEELLADPERAVRRRALWSLALSNPAAALARCRRDSQGDQPGPFSIRVLGLLGSEEDEAADPDDDESNAFRWRRALLDPEQGDAALRREVPDGFFEDDPVEEARAGE